MASITCDRCGTVNLPYATYCASCGRALQAVNASVGASESVNEGGNVSAGTGNGAGAVSSTATGRLQSDFMLKQRYRIMNTIGKGGMGAVYVAEDTRLGNRVVAIKEMSQSGLTPQKIAEATENFKKEAHILAGLQHSQLPGIYDYFTDAGRWYLVMSFIQGESLESYLAKVPGRKLPVQQVLEIGIQLCTVLDYLHTQNPPIIFRDLKPANIMLTPDGRLCLIDFGIARLFKPGQAQDTAAYGSVGYSAPEQYGQAQTTPRSDIYSLGALLHQLITGRPPSLTPFDFPPLHLSGQAVPPALETLIQHMLAMKENKRPPDMASVKRALQQIASELAAGAAFAGAPAPAGPAAPYAPTVLVRQPAPDVMSTAAVSSAPAQVALQRPALSPTVPFQKTAAGQSSGWRLSRPQLIAMLVGTLVCGLLRYLSYSFPFIPWYQFLFNGTRVIVDDRLILTSAVLVITFFLAARYGPWVGLVVGGVGSFAADLLSGSALGLWYLDIGLALAGLVVGLACLKAPGRQNPTHNIGFVDAVSVSGVLIYAVFSALGLSLVDQMAAGETLTLTLAYNAMYLVLTLLLLTLVLVISNVTARRRAIA